MFGKYGWNTLSSHHISAAASRSNQYPRQERSSSSSSSSTTLTAPTQAPLTPRRATTTSSAAAAFAQYRREFGFHEDPRKPWQYYLDSGRRELLELMSHDQHDNLTFSSKSSSPSSSGKQSMMLASNSHSQEGLHALSLRNSPFSDEESDEEDDQMELFFCPEGISRFPFEDVEFDAQKSARLSSIYQGQTTSHKQTKRSPSHLTSSSSPLSSSASSASPVDAHERPSKMRSQRFRSGNVEYSPTPSNSPLMH